jgi:GT2 family glycosyltransferase
MQLSIICPTYNESENIEALISSLLQDDGIEKEIFIVDGGSMDGTIDKVNALMEKHPNINLVINGDRYVSYGFNKAFPLTKGKYITLSGAHSVYPPGFFKTGINALENEDCDAVGGPLRQEGSTDMGNAIAYCMSTKFGVGNTEFRTAKQKMYVDSVAFAIYKKDVFEKAGLLDEELIRNQDDEFHYRLNKYGFKILMLPEMECVYYVRSSLSGLFRQYFGYGLYKPLVIKKIGSVISLRHFIPSLFLIYFLLLPLAFINKYFLLPLLLYVLLDLYFSVRAPGGIKQKLISIFVYPVLHISYGAGFILGLFKKGTKIN